MSLFLTCANANRASACNLACLVKKSRSSCEALLTAGGAAVAMVAVAMAVDCREFFDEARLLDEDNE